MHPSDRNSTLAPGTQRTGNLTSIPPNAAYSIDRPSTSSLPGTMARRPSQAPSMASKKSSSSMYQTAQSTSQTTNSRYLHGGRKIQSQYPADSENSHVEFILVAAFDIDRGSVMEHQYPGPISGDETMLAELMLPDQVHSRAQDWTIFFLHKDINVDDNPSSPSKESDQGDSSQNSDQRNDSDNGRDSPTQNGEDRDPDDPIEDPPLIYVLNYVNTKHSSSVTRGAIVKAMAICTRHSFVDIFKPVLVLAIEDYFKSPTLDTLATLYDSLNSMDLSLMPKFSLLEKMILQASNAKDLFVEKFEYMIEQYRTEEEYSGQQNGKKPGEAGSHTTNPRFFQAPRDTHELESRIHFNGHSVPVKVPTARSQETVGNFSTIKLIQTFSVPHASSPQPFALHPHLTTCGAYTHPIVVLVNALLTQKRIIFLGHNRPSEEVAEAVLAACSLASGGVLRGFTRHAFPYTDLTKVDDLQKVPGFIAGVTNPIFAETPRWWDLLCDLPSGRMKISNKIEHPPVTDGWESFRQQNPSLISIITSPGNQNQDFTGDVAFMESIQKSITNRLGEGVIRSMWRDWISKFTRIAAAFEEIVYGASALYIGGEQADQGDFGLAGHGYVWPDETARQKELAGNLSRIEGWRKTRSFYNFKQDLIHLYNSQPIRNVDLHHHHDRLRTQKLAPGDSAAIYLGLSAAVNTHAEICQLLVVTSESHGGLFYVSLGLLHPRKDVRYRTAELVQRIARHEAGKHFWENLGRFAKTAFWRIKREKESESDISKVASVTQTSVGAM